MRFFTNPFKRKQKTEVHIYPHTFVVTVNVDHPRIIGHVSQFRISIDAHDKWHARKRVLSELKIKIDKNPTKTR